MPTDSLRVRYDRKVLFLRRRNIHAQGWFCIDMAPLDRCPSCVCSSSKSCQTGQKRCFLFFIFTEGVDEYSSVVSPGSWSIVILRPRKKRSTTVGYYMILYDMISCCGHRWRHQPSFVYMYDEYFMCVTHSLLIPFLCWCYIRWCHSQPVVFHLSIVFTQPLSTELSFILFHSHSSHMLHSPKNYGFVFVSCFFFFVFFFFFFFSGPFFSFFCSGGCDRVRVDGILLAEGEHARQRRCR